MHVHACLHVASKINLQADSDLKVTNLVKATPRWSYQLGESKCIACRPLGTKS
jgi:hypothetical protein